MNFLDYSLGIRTGWNMNRKIWGEKNTEIEYKQIKWDEEWTGLSLCWPEIVLCFVLFCFSDIFLLRNCFFPRCVCVFVCARLESIIHDKNRTEENQLSTHISHFQWFLWNSKFRCNVFKFQDKVEHGLVYCCEFYQSFGNSNLDENVEAKTPNSHHFPFSMIFIK